MNPVTDGSIADRELLITFATSQRSVDVLFIDDETSDEGSCTVVETFGIVVIVVILPVQSTATVKCLLTTVDPCLHLMLASKLPRCKQSRGGVSSDESDTHDELPVPRHVIRSCSSCKPPKKLMDSSDDELSAPRVRKSAPG